MPVGARFTASVMPVALTIFRPSVPLPLPVSAVTVHDVPVPAFCTT